MEDLLLAFLKRHCSGFREESPEKAGPSQRKPSSNPDLLNGIAREEPPSTLLARET